MPFAFCLAACSTRTFGVTNIIQEENPTGAGKMVNSFPGQQMWYPVRSYNLAISIANQAGQKMKKFS